MREFNIAKTAKSDWAFHMRKLKTRGGTCSPNVLRHERGAGERPLSQVPGAWFCPRICVNGWPCYSVDHLRKLRTSAQVFLYLDCIYPNIGHCGVLFLKEI